MPESDIATIYTLRRFLKMSVVTLSSIPFPWKGNARRARGWPKGKRAKPTSGATRHLLPEEGGRSGMSNPSTPFPWKGDARRAGVGRRRKRAKPTSGATRHLLPKEGGRSGMRSPSTPFPWKGNARRARGWPRKAWEVLIESQHFILALLS